MQHDVEWLRAQVVLLFEDAKAQDTIDHSVLVKYSELLWKMLPKNVGQKEMDPGELDKIRASVHAARGPKA